MNKVNQFIRNWIIPDKSIILFCVTLLIIVWSGVLWQIDQDRKTTLKTLERDGDRLARAFEEHVRRVLKVNEQYLILLKDNYETANGVTQSTQHLIELLAKDQQVTQLGILGTDGHLMASLWPDPAKADYSQAARLQAHVAADTGQYFLDQATIGPVSNDWSIPLSVRLNKPDSSFSGVAYVSISPDYFNRFYWDMNFNAEYVVRIVGRDGFVRVSSKSSEVGTKMVPADLWKYLEQASSGFYRSNGLFYGKPLLVSYRALDDYPIIVQVGVSESVLAPMVQRGQFYLGGAGAVSLFILLFGGGLVASVRRNRQIDECIKQSYKELAEAHEELIATEEELRNNFDELNNEKAFSSAVLESIPGLLYLYDDRWRLVRWNKNHETATGYSAEELSHMTLLDWYKGDQETIKRISGEVAKALQTGMAFSEGLLQNKDGSKTPYYFTAVKTTIDEQPYFVGIGIDVTEQKKAQAELVEKEKRLQSSLEELTASHEELLATDEELRNLYDEVVAANENLAQSRQAFADMFNAVADGLVVFDKNGEVLAINRRMTDMFGYTEEELTHQGTALSSIRTAVTEGTQPLSVRETFDRYGRNLVVEISSSTVLLNGKKCFLALIRDVTARKLMEENMEFLRKRDPLTGVYNRAYFETDIMRMQSSELRGIGMFVCDVDGLKLINDTLGHRQGDELLRKVAEILNSGARKKEYVARIGGDEFAVVLVGATQPRMEELERFYRTKVEKYNHGNPHLPLSLSMGWALETQQANIEVIFKTADNNMYRQKLHQRQSVRSSIVQIMMKALEEKDHITEGHADRVGELMEIMGFKLMLPQNVVADLRLLAKFHDIGKVGISDSILKKPGKLTEDEMTIMRQHCEIGYRIARSSPDLEPIADWILKHQEHWDGGGYPLGVSGEDIPIQCRILGIVDAFDAMTNDRPYRKAMSIHEAMAELQRCAGKQFDPQLVDIFVSIIMKEHTGMN